MTSCLITAMLEIRKWSNDCLQNTEGNSRNATGYPLSFFNENSIETICLMVGSPPQIKSQMLKILGEF